MDWIWGCLYFCCVEAAKNTQSDTSAEGGIEQSEKLKETAENHDIPEDVLAVLQVLELHLVKTINWFLYLYKHLKTLR